MSERLKRLQDRGARELRSGAVCSLVLSLDPVGGAWASCEALCVSGSGTTATQALREVGERIDAVLARPADEVVVSGRRARG